MTFFFMLHPFPHLLFIIFFFFTHYTNTAVSISMKATGPKKVCSRASVEHVVNVTFTKATLESKLQELCTIVSLLSVTHKKNTYILESNIHSNFIIYTS